MSKKFLFTLSLSCLFSFPLSNPAQANLSEEFEEGKIYLRQRYPDFDFDFVFAHRKFEDSVAESMPRAHDINHLFILAIRDFVKFVLRSPIYATDEGREIVEGLAPVIYHLRAAPVQAPQEAARQREPVRRELLY